MLDDLQTEADKIAWFHSIDLGGGVTTRGIAQAITAEELPDFAGRTTLDIGAWDGKYSFLAERMGASRVVALDHYAWGVDMAARGQYWDECRAAGVLPDHSKDLTEFWRENLPGQAGFKFAKQALRSSVEPLVGDFMTMDLASVGSFDVVLYLGVLYHMKEPLTALERVRQVTNEIAVIETQALWLEGLEPRPLLDFFAGDDVARDFGNWYVPTIEALHAMCKGAGFTSVRTAVGPPVVSAADAVDEPRWSHYRAVVHAVV